MLTSVLLTDVSMLTLHFAGICVQTKVLGQILILMMMWHFTIFHNIITELYFYDYTVLFN